MIFDHRTYTCRPFTLRKYIALYEQHGFDVQRSHLGAPVLIAATEVGDVNSYVHIWGYESVADRAQKRKALQADPRWQDYLRLCEEAGYLLRQQTKILLSVGLSHPAAV